MALAPLLTDGALDALRQFDTCMVANAVETFNVRLRNTGFTNADIRCRFEDAPPMVGYAATARLRITRHSLQVRRCTSDGGLCGHGAAAQRPATRGGRHVPRPRRFLEQHS